MSDSDKPDEVGFGCLKEGRVTLDISGGALKEMLSYIYLKQATPDFDQFAKELMPVAKTYHLDGLILLCDQALILRMLYGKDQDIVELLRLLVKSRSCKPQLVDYVKLLRDALKSQNETVDRELILKVTKEAHEQGYDELKSDCEQNLMQKVNECPNLNVPIILELASAADKYGLNDLSVACGQWLARNLEMAHNSGQLDDVIEDKTGGLFTRLILEWCCQNGLKNNSAKTTALTIGTHQNRRNLPENQTIRVGTTQVAVSNTAKNLGLVLDQQLNYLPHLNWVSKKCKRELFALNRIKSCIPRQILKNTIQSTVLSRLYYAPSVIAAAPKSYIEQSLVPVVNFGAKLVFGQRKFDSATEARKRLGWLDAHTELKKRSELMAYNILHGHCEIELTHPISVTENRRSTRLNRRPQFQIPKFLSDGARRSFSYRAPTYSSKWNV